MNSVHNMWRNSKLERPLKLLSYTSKITVWEFVTQGHYLTVCWPAPAALHTNIKIFTGTPWLRNSDDSAPDEGNL